MANVYMKRGSNSLLIRESKFKPQRPITPPAKLKSTEKPRVNNMKQLDWVSIGGVSIGATPFGQLFGTIS